MLKRWITFLRDRPFLFLTFFVSFFCSQSTGWFITFFWAIGYFLLFHFCYYCIRGEDKFRGNSPWSYFSQKAPELLLKFSTLNRNSYVSEKCRGLFPANFRVLLRINPRKETRFNTRNLLPSWKEGEYYLPSREWLFNPF